MKRYENGFLEKIKLQHGIGIPDPERCLKLTRDSGSLTFAIARRFTEPRGSKELRERSARSISDRTGLSIKENHSLRSLHERYE